MAKLKGGDAERDPCKQYGHDFAESAPIQQNRDTIAKIRACKRGGCHVKEICTKPDTWNGKWGGWSSY